MLSSPFRQKPVLFSWRLLWGMRFMLSSPFRQKPVLFSWRLPPHEPSSLPAGANYYTQPFYQTMLKFSIACSDKDLLLMRRQRERRRNWQAGQRGPSLLLANLRTLPASHLASKVAWSHFSLVGDICPQAPLNDFCKIGCAPAELSSPAAHQEIAALCEYVIDTFSVSGYT